MAFRNAFLSGLALVGGAALLAGCSAWTFQPPIHGDVNSERINLSRDEASRPADAGNFAQELAYHYAGFTDLLTHSGHTSPGDWVDVDYFARKGQAAARGEIVPPEQNSNWAIPLEQPYNFRTQMAQARVRLVNDLDRGGRDRFPGLAARAQVDYDCWLERTEGDWAHEFDGACHKDFVATLTALEAALSGTPAPAPAAAVHRYNVYFDFNRSILTPEGRQIVNTVAKAAKADAHIRIALVGKADLVGTDPYNMALSHRRANAVRAALKADGIDLSRVDETWVGFRQPPVPTAPGVREPRNRVVEVTLQ